MRRVTTAGCLFDEPRQRSGGNDVEFRGSLETRQSPQAVYQNPSGRRGIRGCQLEAVGQAWQHVQFGRNPGSHQPASVLDVLVAQDVEITHLDVGIGRPERSVAPAGAAYGDTLSPNSAGPSIAPQPVAVGIVA